jgi:phosphate transport system ATP-binding protein
MNKQNSLKLIDTFPADKTVAVLETVDFNAWFGDTRILTDINIAFAKHRINCIVGPSGGGKSTLIRCINRLNDDLQDFTVQGGIDFNGRNSYDRNIDVTQLRSKIGIVLQKPCVFPKSIRENVLFGIQHLRKLSKQDKSNIVEKTLSAVSLWREVAHRLDDPAESLSLGQQQRLCIARTLAVNPEVILLDEPTSALDPIATRAIETLLLKLKTRYTLIFVTHNILQAKRIADKLVFLCDGQVVEQGDKDQLFNNPRDKRTRDYLHDEFCAC